MLDKLWDDTLAGPHPERGLEKLRVNTNLNNTEGADQKYKRSISMPSGSSSTPSTPTTPGTPGTPNSVARKDNVWRSVFHPGSNLKTRSIGAHIFDKPTETTSPTVYDWLYSGDTRSKHV